VSGVIWLIFAFAAILIFLIVATYRTLAIIRLPVHLRWELAPIPHERGKQRYGGSYLEEYEWWEKPRPKSLLAPLQYMLVEIFLLRAIWRHNRPLWPLSFAFHTGIYLVFFMLLFSLISAILIIAQVPLSVLNVFLIIVSVLALAGYLLGGLGTIGLILKRALDSSLRSFNTFSKYFNLVFLGAIFTSGAYAWLSLPDFASEMTLFIKGLITLDVAVTASFPLTLHIIISLLFLIYLPFTDMIHFIAKYFTYHEIRWDDRPQDREMKKELRRLLSQPVSWSATHVKADGRKNWLELTTRKTNDDKEA
jgi:nitrate reductase gamma subunit